MLLQLSAVVRILPSINTFINMRHMEKKSKASTQAASEGIRKQMDVFATVAATASFAPSYKELQVCVCGMQPICTT